MNRMQVLLLGNSKLIEVTTAVVLEFGAYVVLSLNPHLVG